MSVKTRATQPRAVTGRLHAALSLGLPAPVGMTGQHHDPPRLLRQLDTAPRAGREPARDLPVRQIAGLRHLEGAQHRQVEPSRADQRESWTALSKKAEPGIVET